MAEILHHQGCIKPRKKRDKLPTSRTSTGEFAGFQPSTASPWDHGEGENRAYHQLGNAVCPPVIKAIAERVLATIRWPTAPPTSKEIREIRCKSLSHPKYKKRQCFPIKNSDLNHLPTMFFSRKHLLANGTSNQRKATPHVSIGCIPWQRIQQRSLSWLGQCFRLFVGQKGNRQRKSVRTCTKKTCPNIKCKICKVMQGIFPYIYHKDWPNVVNHISLYTLSI